MKKYFVYKNKRYGRLDTVQTIFGEYIISDIVIFLIKVFATSIVIAMCFCYQNDLAIKILVACLVLVSLVAYYILFFKTCLFYANSKEEVLNKFQAFYKNKENEMENDLVNCLKHNKKYKNLGLVVDENGAMIVKNKLFYNEEEN